MTAIWYDLLNCYLQGISLNSFILNMGAGVQKLRSIAFKIFLFVFLVKYFVPFVLKEITTKNTMISRRTQRILFRTPDSITKIKELEDLPRKE